MKFCHLYIYYPVIVAKSLTLSLILATVYGKGVYFARDAYYSARDTYSPRDTNGYKYVYLARVITGEFTVASRDMIDTPTKPDDTKYDSAVDNVQNPQIFIVFQDAVVYPEYLIVFT